MGISEERPADDAGVDARELRGRIARTVHELRTRSGRSLAEVAAAAGIGKSTLHAIESEDANPGIETLWALARALEVPFGTLLEPPQPAVRVVRAGEGPRVDSEGEQIQARLIATTAHAARTEVYALTLQSAQGRDAAPHTPGITEHVLVTTGRVRVGPLDATVELGPGDLASFPGDVPHRYEALDEPAEAVLLIEYA